MPIEDYWRKLIPEQIKNAPDFPGVYEFADILQERLFIGKTQSLAQTIQQVFEKREPIFSTVNFFKFHATQDFEQEYTALIEEYKQQFNKLPPLNQKMAAEE